MKKQRKRQKFGRMRADSGQHRRIMAMMLVFGVLAFIPVSVRLCQLMIAQYDYYADLALRNQTRTTTVTAHRGTIYDRNMNIMALSVTVENVYLDPQELRQSKADIPAVSKALGEILNLDAAWIQEKASDRTYRYQQIAANVDADTAARIRSYINSNGISGIHLEPSSERTYPYGTLAAQVIGFTNASNTGAEGIEAAYDSYLEGKSGTVITTKGNNEMDMPYSYEDFMTAQAGCSVVLTIRLLAI